MSQLTTVLTDPENYSVRSTLHRECVQIAFVKTKSRLVFVFFFVTLLPERNSRLKIQKLAKDCILHSILYEGETIEEFKTHQITT